MAGAGAPWTGKAKVMDETIDLLMRVLSFVLGVFIVVVLVGAVCNVAIYVLLVHLVKSLLP